MPRVSLTSLAPRTTSSRAVRRPHSETRRCRPSIQRGLEGAGLITEPEPCGRRRRASIGCETSRVHAAVAMADVKDLSVSAPPSRSTQGGGKGRPGQHFRPVPDVPRAGSRSNVTSQTPPLYRPVAELMARHSGRLFAATGNDNWKRTVAAAGTFTVPT
jgi:hypothetical protein